jgi:hypothetical protein
LALKNPDGFVAAYFILVFLELVCFYSKKANLDPIATVNNYDILLDRRFNRSFTTPKIPVMNIRPLFFPHQIDYCSFFFRKTAFFFNIIHAFSHSV